MLRVVRASHYVLTCIDNNNLAVATRYNFLWQNSKPSTLNGRKAAHLKIWGVAHYHPSRSRLFQY
jgi:hypothetical protein